MPARARSHDQGPTESKGTRHNHTFLHAPAQARLHSSEATRLASPAGASEVASRIASQLREIEAKAALEALHSSPSLELHALEPVARAKPLLSENDDVAPAAGYASVLGATATAEKDGGSGKATALPAAELPLPPAEQSGAAPAALLSGQHADATGIGGWEGGMKTGGGCLEAFGESGSHETRKKNDREKKRRKRSRTGGLVRLLDQCMPQFHSSHMQRSINEVLRDAGAAIRSIARASQNIVASGSASIPGPGMPVPSSHASAGIVAAAAQSTELETQGSDEGGGLALVGKDGVLGTIIREGLLASPVVGVGLISRDLRVLHANAALVSLLDASCPAAAGAAAEAEQATERRQGCRIKGKEHELAQWSVAEGANLAGGEWAGREEEAPIAAKALQGRVTGQSLRDSMPGGDARRLELAVEQLCGAALPDENLRRCVLGLHFSQLGGDGEMEAGGRKPLAARQVELVACTARGCQPGSEPVFAVFVFGHTLSDDGSHDRVSAQKSVPTDKGAKRLALDPDVIKENCAGREFVPRQPAAGVGV